jgi:acyl transferase domain-containing protein
VRFAAVFDTLREAGCTTFVEIGPHPTLLGLGRRIWPDAAATWVPSMRRDGDEVTRIVTALAAVHTAGHEVDWAGFDGHGRRRPRLRLPTYPWQRQSYWSAQARSASQSRRGRRWDAAVGAARRQAEQGPLDLDVGAYPRRWAVLDDVAAAYITRCLRQLALFERPGEQRAVGELVEAGTITPGYAGLVTRWLEHLVADDQLRRDGDVFVADTPLAGVDVDALLAAPGVAFEGIQSVLDYVRRCGERLAAVVRGEETALATLFPEGSYETVDFLYGGWAIPRYFNAIVGAAVAAVAAAAPAGQTRVVEVGAGTGGTTAAVLPVLPADRTIYTFTDVSDFFLTRAAERFAAHDFVRYARLDVERRPEDQGFPSGGADVVIAANVLHATRHLDETLAHVRSLLAPGGVLIAYEGTRHPRWFDITTGLIEGWQRFDDTWRTDVPLLDAPRWLDALRSAGFAEADAVPDEAVAATLLHHVLVARAPGDEAAAPRAADAGPAVLMAGAPAAGPIDTGDLRAELATALPDERHDVVVDAVRHAVAGVLRIADPGTLRRDQPLLDLGFDSLMAVELRNVLRGRLALDHKLPATLVFDHPTISAIATHLETLLAGPSSAAESGTVAGPKPDPRPTLDVSTVAELSDDEVEAMLLSRLAEVER